jgi:hypothetical protein
MRIVRITTALAAAVAALAAAGLDATAAHAEGNRNHLWTSLSDPWTLSAEGKFPTPSGTQRLFQVFDRLGGDGLVPWVNIQVPDGRTFQFDGIEGGSATYSKNYDISKWRLCDPRAGYCTGWVDAPRP